MGFDTERFEAAVDSEFVCGICHMVLQNPLQAEPCQHVFCGDCINTWLARHNNCPMDRQELHTENLHTLPRLIQNLLNKLKLRCRYRENGCTQIVTYEQVLHHEQVCHHNPDTVALCVHGCGLRVAANGHDCVKDLRSMLDEQVARTTSLQMQVAELNNTLTQQQVQLESFLTEHHTSHAWLRQQIEKLQEQGSEHVMLSFTICKAERFLLEQAGEPKLGMPVIAKNKIWALEAVIDIAPNEDGRRLIVTVKCQTCDKHWMHNACALFSIGYQDVQLQRHMFKTLHYGDSTLACDAVDVKDIVCTMNNNQSRKDNSLTLDVQLVLK